MEYQVLGKTGLKESNKTMQEIDEAYSFAQKLVYLKEDELVTNKQKKFIADYNPNLDLTECAVKLANIAAPNAYKSHLLSSAFLSSFFFSIIK